MPGCKWSEFREFFQAREIDRNTHIEVSTRPLLGKQGIENAAVFIDDEKVSDTTPYLLKNVSPGKHHIRVKAPGYVTQELEVDAKEGQTTRPSLALQPLPTEPGQAPRTPQGNDTPLPRKKREDVVKDEPGVESAKHTLLLTASPTVTVSVDGAEAGTAVGLRAKLGKANGQLKLGEGADAVTFSYISREHTVALRVKDIGARTLSVDGQPAIAREKPFEIDTRPRRFELLSVEGQKQVILLKMVD